MKLVGMVMSVALICCLLTLIPLIAWVGMAVLMIVGFMAISFRLPITNDKRQEL